MNILRNKDYQIEYEEINVEEVLYTGEDDISYEQFIKSKKKNKEVVVQTTLLKENEIGNIVEIKAVRINSNEYKNLIVINLDTDLIEYRNFFFFFFGTSLE